MFQLHKATQEHSTRVSILPHQCSCSYLAQGLLGGMPNSPDTFLGLDPSVLLPLPPDSRVKQLCPSSFLTSRSQKEKQKQGVICVSPQTQRHLWVLISFSGLCMGSWDNPQATAETVAGTIQFPCSVKAHFISHCSPKCTHQPEPPPQHPSSPMSLVHTSLCPSELQDPLFQ